MGDDIVCIDDDGDVAPPSPASKARMELEAQQRRQRREEKRRQRELAASRAGGGGAGGAPNANAVMIDLTDENAAPVVPAAQPAVQPPRHLPPYMAAKAGPVGGGGGGASASVNFAAAAAAAVSKQMQALKANLVQQQKQAAAPPRVVPPPVPPPVPQHQLAKHAHHPYPGYQPPHIPHNNYDPFGYNHGYNNKAEQQLAKQRAKDAAQLARQEEQERQDDQDVGVSEKDAQTKTFCKYQCLSSIDEKFGFNPHPDNVNETSSMSSVPSPPTKHKLILPWRILTEGKLTQVQIESILYASAQHELRLPDGTRAGFFLGDGPGVGKGRQIAGMIAENHFRKVNNRDRAVWISVSADLIWDARRDLRDLGLHSEILCHDLKSYAGEVDLNKCKDCQSGVFFCTYALLIRESKAGVRRIDQLVNWCGGKDFNGIVALDECHRAKHMTQTKDHQTGEVSVKEGTGTTKSAMFVFELQKLLPNARIVYVSATGATEPQHMAVFSRMGLWGPRTAFKDSFEFINQIKNGECGAMELVAMHMKASGQYLCRVLAFDGATFEIKKDDLTPEFKEMYNKASEFWEDLIAERDAIHEEARLKAQAAGSGARFQSPLNASLLWGCHQRFWMQMCMAAKIKSVVEIAKKAAAENKCVVIGLQNTGESVNEFVKKDLLGDDVPSTASGIITWFVKKHCNNFSAQAKILEAAEELKLPGNPLDEIIDQLGGPSKVAEMTGRKTRMVRDRKSGQWQLVDRARSGEDTINVQERKAFQEGHKIFAIISEAASSGISLQADRRVPNQKRRVHITMQLPWSADKAVQQMGRSHRSNQSSAPEYKLLFSPLGGEARFASAVASRLQSLGALTQGDRRAAGYSQDLVEFAIDSKHGLAALKQMLELVWKLEPPPSDVELPEFKALVSDAELHRFLEAAKDQLELCGMRKKAQGFRGQGCKVKTFLNRILGIQVDLQNQIFALFSDLLQAHIRVAKQNNSYDEGIVDIAAQNVVVREETELYKDKRSNAPTSMVHVQGDRGVSFEQALDMLQEQLAYSAAHQDKNGEAEKTHAGFYKNGREVANPSFILILRKMTVGQGKNRYIRVAPGTGHHNNDEHITDILKTWEKVPNPESARSFWEQQYKYAEKNCGHKKNLVANSSCTGPLCEFKKRMKNYYLLCGLVLPFWNVMKNVWRIRMDTGGDVVKVKVVRTTVSGGRRIVGVLIPSHELKKIEDKIKEGVPDAEHLSNLSDRIVDDPLFKVMETMEARACMNPQGVDTFNFDMKSGWEKSDGANVMIKIRAFKIPHSNAANAVDKDSDQQNQEGETDLEDAGWINCSVLINGSHVVQGNIHEPRSIDITQYCKLGKNELSVIQQGERFIVSLQKGTATPMEEVKKYIQHAPMAESKALLEKIITQEDDIACDEVEVSLRCPVGFIRIAEPARGKGCKHIQCFDLNTFLDYGARYGKSKCFHCNENIPVSQLRICKLMKSVLDAASDISTSVKLMKDGTFKEMDTALDLQMNESQDDDAAGAGGNQRKQGAVGAAANKKSALLQEDAGEQLDVSGLRPEIRKLLESGSWEYNEEVNNRYESKVKQAQQQSAKKKPKRTTDLSSASESDSDDFEKEVSGRKAKAAAVEEIESDDVEMVLDDDAIQETDEEEEDIDLIDTVAKGKGSAAPVLRVSTRVSKRTSYVDFDTESDEDDDDDKLERILASHSSTNGEGSGSREKRKRDDEAADNGGSSSLGFGRDKSRRVAPARVSPTNSADSSGSKGKGHGKAAARSADLARSMMTNDDEDSDWP